MTTTKNSPTPTYYACGRSLYERGNDDRPAAECRSDADCAYLASLTARVAELEVMLTRAAAALDQAGARIAKDHAATLARNGQIYPVPCADADHATVAAHDARALLAGGGK